MHQCSLKFRAANIGAQKLQTLAAALEQACEQRVDSELISARLTPVEQELSLLLSELTLALPAAQDITHTNEAGLSIQDTAIACIIN